MESKRDPRAESAHVATDFLRLRPLVVAPLLAIVLACLALAGAPTRQIGGFSVAGVSFLAFFLRERRSGARRVVSARALQRSLVATLVGISIGATLTGGLASPLVPMLFAPVGVGFAAFGRVRPSGVLFALLVVAVAALFALTPLVAPLAVAEPWRRIAFAAAAVDAAVLLYVGSASLAAAHARAADALVAAGDQIVRASEARTREVETMGGRVAHEVKNPLAAIRALVEVMLESADERAGKRLRVAAGEIARIEQILDGYRSFTHPLDTIRRTRTDIVALVHDVVVVLEARAARAGVRLTTPDVNDATEVHAEVDPDRLTEATLNLILNALDATPAGGKVAVEVTRDGDGVLVSVRDDGLGMDAETLARAGTPYFTTKKDGTGLGVSIVRRTADQHGGTLRFASEPGKGTTATLRIVGSA